MAQVKVLFQGSFDILNLGHVRAFAYAKSKGDFLYVALNTDELLKSYKNRVAVMPWEHKKEIIESIRYVDKVIPAPDFSPLKLLKEYDIDVYVVGDEWVDTKEEELNYMYSKGGYAVISPRFGGISTREIKTILLNEHLDAQNENNKRAS